MTITDILLTLFWFVLMVRYFFLSEGREDGLIAAGKNVLATWGLFMMFFIFGIAVAGSGSPPAPDMDLWRAMPLLQSEAGARIFLVFMTFGGGWLILTAVWFYYAFYVAGRCLENIVRKWIPSLRRRFTDTSEDGMHILRQLHGKNREYAIRFLYSRRRR